MTRAFFANWLGTFAEGWAVARAVPWLVAAMMGRSTLWNCISASSRSTRRCAALRPRSRCA